jgi:hypothetical protein
MQYSLLDGIASQSSNSEGIVPMDVSASIGLPREPENGPSGSRTHDLPIQSRLLYTRTVESAGYQLSYRPVSGV